MIFNSVCIFPPQFMKYIFLPSVYPIYYYADKSMPIPLEDQHVLFENKLLGMPRLRQKRVKEGSCTVSSAMESLSMKCYSPYSDSVEETEPFDKCGSNASA